LSFEKSVDIEKHTRKHTPQGPNVKRIVVLSVFHKELGAFIVSTGHADVVIDVRLVEISKTPINKPQVPCSVIYYDIQRLYIPVDHSVRVGVVQSLQYFESVKSNVHVTKLMNKKSRLRIGYVFKY
jgi:hypothetical protein